MLCKLLLLLAICTFCAYAQGPQPQPGTAGPAPGPARPSLSVAPQLKPTVPQTCVPKCKEPDETCVRISECQGAKCHVCALTRSVRLPGAPVAMPSWPVRQMPQRPMGGLGMPNVPSMAAMAGMSQAMARRGNPMQNPFQSRGFTDLITLRMLGEIGLF